MKKKKERLLITVKVVVEFYPDGQFTFDANDVAVDIAKKIDALVVRRKKGDR